MKKSNYKKYILLIISFIISFWLINRIINKERIINDYKKINLKSIEKYKNIPNIKIKPFITKNNIINYMTSNNCKLSTLVLKDKVYKVQIKGNIVNLLKNVFDISKSLRISIYNIALNKINNSEQFYLNLTFKEIK